MSDLSEREWGVFARILPERELDEATIAYEKHQSESGVVHESAECFATAWKQRAERE